MESMIRALQPDLMAYTTALIVALIVYLVAKYIAGKALKNGASEEDVALGRTSARYIVIIIIILTVIAGAFRIMNFSAVNRVPRSDVNGSTVYERMNENAEPTKPKQ